MPIHTGNGFEWFEIQTHLVAVSSRLMALKRMGIVKNYEVSL